MSDASGDLKFPCLLLHFPIHHLISYHDRLHFVVTFEAPVYEIINFKEMMH